MTDNKFMLLISKASADDRYYFTFSQLYTVWRKVKNKVNIDIILIIFIVFGFLALMLFSNMEMRGSNIKDFTWFILLCLILLITITGYYLIQSPPNREEFRTLVDKWSYFKGVPEKMLVKPSLHEPPPEFPEGDLYDYGVERIIIVEHQLLVDLLVKNGFHTEQRALIFSVDDYPYYIAERAKILLKASPDLPIYLLHDATEKGGAMKQKINYPEHKVIDLGISPDQIKNLSALKPLRLKHQQYQASLDVLPYAALSAIGGAAIAAGVPFDEVLESWKKEGNSVGDSSVSSYG